MAAASYRSHLHRSTSASTWAITVVIPSRDERLVKWTEWGREHCTPDKYEWMIKSGGERYETWYVYFGAILPEQFRAVDYL
jgi:hypothetical protein